MNPDPSARCVCSRGTRGAPKKRRAYGSSMRSGLCLLGACSVACEAERTGGQNNWDEVDGFAHGTTLLADETHRTRQQPMCRSRIREVSNGRRPTQISTRELSRHSSGGRAARQSKRPSAPGLASRVHVVSRRSRTYHRRTPLPHRTDSLQQPAPCAEIGGPNDELRMIVTNGPACAGSRFNSKRRGGPAASRRCSRSATPRRAVSRLKCHWRASERRVT
jgi:hypothetical protein